MIRRMFRRCGTAPGTALAPGDQAVVDAFRAMQALSMGSPNTPVRPPGSLWARLAAARQDSGRAERVKFLFSC
jgi:hypothetical protein